MDCRRIQKNAIIRRAEALLLLQNLRTPLAIGN